MYLARARQVAGNQGEDDGESDASTGDEVSVSHTVQRVHITPSPYLDAFHEHIPVQLTMDSGATGNMMKASVAAQLGVKVTRTTQTAHQADGKSLLKVVGETRTSFQRDRHELYFEGLVVENLDSDILAGTPFMKRNKVSVHPAEDQVHVGKDAYLYGTCPATTDRYAVRRAHVG